VNIYVGNLAPQVKEDDLHSAFSAHGEVISVTLIKDRFSGEPRGFAFIEMPEKAQAIAAIQAMNGYELQGRTLIVNEARPREERRGGGGGGGHRRSGGGNDRRGRDDSRGRRRPY
jgi:RNA recognition motif-containing protein